MPALRHADVPDVGLLEEIRPGKIPAFRLQRADLRFGWSQIPLLQPGPAEIDSCLIWAT